MNQYSSDVVVVVSDFENEFAVEDYFLVAEFVYEYYCPVVEFVADSTVVFAANTAAAVVDDADFETAVDDAEPTADAEIAAVTAADYDVVYTELDVSALL